MIRRRAVRERLGEASFGRRRPTINSAEIKEEISYFRRLAIIARNFTSSSTKEISKETKTQDSMVSGREFKRAGSFTALKQIECNSKKIDLELL